MVMGNWFLSLIISAITGDIFCEICDIWSVHVRYSFRIMPKKLKDFTLLIGMPSSSNFMSSNTDMFRCLEWNIITFVLSTFKDSLLIFNHSCINSSSVFIRKLRRFTSPLVLAAQSWKFVNVPIRLVSSAKRIAWNSLDTFEISFIYREFLKIGNL